MEENLKSRERSYHRLPGQAGPTLGEGRAVLSKTMKIVTIHCTGSLLTEILATESSFHYIILTQSVTDLDLDFIHVRRKQLVP